MSVIIRKPRFYSTAFPLTENPLSEGGKWVNGATLGLDWKDCRTTPGQAFGAAVSPSPPFDDPTAILAGLWGRTQICEATVIVPASPAGSEEVELRLLTSIQAHRIVGYEALFSVVSGNHYCDIERWDGGTTAPFFTSLVSGGFQIMPQALVTGNRIKATIDASGVIVASVDFGAGWVVVATGTADTTYTTGSPGIGFFGKDAAVMSDFGLSQFSALAY